MEHVAWITNRFLNFCLVILMAFSGCKKDAGTPAFQDYFRFKMNGAGIECNQHFQATHLPPTVGPDNLITISGGWPGGAITLELNEGVVLTPGDYPFRADKWRTAKIITNTPPFLYSYSAGWGGIGTPTLYGSGQITLTEISADFVKGTFFFTSAKDPVSGEIKTVTDGSFFLERDH